VPSPAARKRDRTPFLMDFRSVANHLYLLLLLLLKDRRDLFLCVNNIVEILFIACLQEIDGDSELVCVHDSARQLVRL
jgi:hypothetical protein